MITIENLRKCKPDKPYDFYIDRRSPVGNPFVLKDETGRDDACDFYEEYFNRMLRFDNIEFNNYLNIMLKTLEVYGKLRLFCWCSPKRCHGETIRKYLNSKFDGPLFVENI